MIALFKIMITRTFFILHEWTCRPGSHNWQNHLKRWQRSFLIHRALWSLDLERSAQRTRIETRLTFPSATAGCLQSKAQSPMTGAIIETQVPWHHSMSWKHYKRYNFTIHEKMLQWCSVQKYHMFVMFGGFTSWLSRSSTCVLASNIWLFHKQSLTVGPITQDPNSTLIMCCLQTSGKFTDSSFQFEISKSRDFRIRCCIRIRIESQRSSVSKRRPWVRSSVSRPELWGQDNRIARDSK